MIDFFINKVYYISIESWILQWMGFPSDYIVLAKIFYSPFLSFFIRKIYEGIKMKIEQTILGLIISSVSVAMGGMKCFVRTGS